MIKKIIYNFLIKIIKRYFRQLYYKIRCSEKNYSILNCFGNGNPYNNGEFLFFNEIRDKCKIIFDVGAKDSIFIKNNFEIHYFEPIYKDIKKLEKIENNKNAIFNCFGLSDKKDCLKMYLPTNSFVDTNIIGNTQNIKVIKGSKYIIKNNIKEIDFLKIDVEGFELNVIKGFENYIKIIKIIQFEYSKFCYINNTKLIDIINYLKEKGFINFNYLNGNGKQLINGLVKHQEYCNVVCFNSKYKE